MDIEEKKERLISMLSGWGMDAEEMAMDILEVLSIKRNPNSQKPSRKDRRSVLLFRNGNMEAERGWVGEDGEWYKSSNPYVPVNPETIDFYVYPEDIF